MTRVGLGTAAIAGAANRKAAEEIRRSFSVRIIADPNPGRILQARLGVLILLRSFAHVELAGIPLPALGLQPSLANRLESPRPARAGFTIAFADALQDADLYAGSTGWTATLSTTGPKSNAGNILAALHAAALATQQAYNHAYAALVPGMVVLNGDSTVDLAAGAQTQPDLPTASPTIDAMLVGAGAVGQAIVYALAQLPTLHGILEIIDHEDIDPSNTERYLLATLEMVGQPKTLIARNEIGGRHPFLSVRVPNPDAQYFNGVVQFRPIEASITPRRIMPANATSPGWNLPTALVLNPVTVPFTYQGWHDMDGGRPRRFVIAAVDSAVARRDIQFGLHETCMNVWTDSGENRSTWGVSLHRIGGSACMGCQYHDPTDDPGSADDFHARQVGWTAERVRQHYANPARRLTADEVGELQVHTGMEDAPAKTFIGKTLKEFVAARCGDGAGIGNDRLGAPPVPHVPVIAGIQAAATLVLHALGGAPATRVQGDALRAPAMSAILPLPEAKTGCLCGNPTIQSWYQDYWAIDETLNNPPGA